MRKATGWVAILIALFGTFVGIVPGAGSLFGMAISIFAVILSLFSITKNTRTYFHVTAGIAFAGIFLLNSALGLWFPMSMPLNFRLGLSAVVLIVFGMSWWAARRLGSTRCHVGNP
jgi:hypothetical protein